MAYAINIPPSFSKTDYQTIQRSIGILRHPIFGSHTLVTYISNLYSQEDMRKLAAELLRINISLSYTPNVSFVDERKEKKETEDANNDKVCRILLTDLQDAF